MRLRNYTLFQINRKIYWQCFRAFRMSRFSAFSTLRFKFNRKGSYPIINHSDFKRNLRQTQYTLHFANTLLPAF